MNHIDYLSEIGPLKPLLLQYKKMYTYACVGKSRIVGTLYHTDSKDFSDSHYCNDEDHSFDYQLDQWGVEKFFQNSDEVIIIELKLYVEYWEN